jgi:hypothetical protein
MSSEFEGDHDQPAPEPRGLIDTLRDAMESALRIAEASLALLRAELALAQRSAVRLLVLALVLIFFGVGAWLATSAAIAAGIYELTGNAFYGIGFVALCNIAGIAAVVIMMKRSLHDLTLPKTRELLLNRAPHDNATTPASAHSPESP